MNDSIKPPAGCRSATAPFARVKGFALAFFLVAWVMTPLPPATDQMHELMRLLSNTIALVMAMTLVAKAARERPGSYGGMPAARTCGADV